MTVISTITANIECLILINAFGMEQTLGNVFFAATFLVTDILSENHGKNMPTKLFGWVCLPTYFYFNNTKLDALHAGKV